MHSCCDSDAIEIRKLFCPIPSLLLFTFERLVLRDSLTPVRLKHIAQLAKPPCDGDFVYDAVDLILENPTKWWRWKLNLGQRAYFI